MAFSMRIKNKNTIEIGILFLTFIYFQNILTVFLGIDSSMFVFINVNPLSIISLCLFLTIIILTLFKKEFYFLFLPIILIAFPNVINDLFPSFYFSPLNEKNASTFSIFTHIDIYLLFGLALFSKNQSNYRFNLGKNSSYLILLLTSYYILILIFKSITLVDIYLLSIGNYVIRYALLMIIFFSFIHINNTRKKKIIYGIGLSVFFLFFEALLNTKIHGFDRLASGTLAINVFGNLMSAIALFYIFLGSYLKIHKVFKLVVILLAISIVVLTQTKMALFTLLFIVNIIIIINLIRKKSIIHLTLIIILYLALIPIIYNIILSQEVYMNFFNSINSEGLETNLHTSSIFTRFLLFETSYNMIIENPFLGIGSGRWNFYKMDYGFPYNVLIDPHNDFLSYISMFGVLIGPVMIYLLILQPAFLLLKEKLYYNTNKYIWGIIPLSLFFAAFSNANTYKHQVTALIFLIFVITAQIRKEDNENSNTRHKRNTKPLRRV
ncbi:MAG: Unknown protein [uncultured Sulfurovum sp.]|uniref:O-antigen ligase-related domain-containing protein n=1 Tax=uncultured Sulfurovum sp. TaxID=269237 RepID=A0A6S6TDW5_9BACT|nr:MAG: Unknown protein [uncultured Sulfurovum sp.]